MTAFETPEPISLAACAEALKGLKARLAEQADDIALLAATVRADALYVDIAHRAVEAALEALDD